MMGQILLAVMLTITANATPTCEFVGRKNDGKILTRTDAIAAGVAPRDHVSVYNLEARQNNSEGCSSTYTARNGLNFTLYCDQMIQGNGMQHQE